MMNENTNSKLTPMTKPGASTQLPIEISLPEWDEILKQIDVREGWGLDETDTAEEFRKMVYGVKFKFVSDCPGYVGDLFILQGGSLEEPIRLIRENGKLVSLPWQGEAS